MIFKNKRGSKIISVYWFFILVVVAGGVFMMVNSFYNHPYDVREVEAEILAEKVSDCVYYAGEFNQELFISEGIFSELFKNNFLESCGLEFGEISPYYFEINFYKYPNPTLSLFTIKEGNPNWKPDCNLKDEDYGNTVTCVEKEFHAVSDSDQIYFIRILSMVRKTEQNVK